jgi:apolipoprotein N-acyltransferase
MSLATRMGTGLRALTGWRRAAAAFGLGAFSATAFAPLGFFPAILIAYAGLLLLLDGADTATKPLRRAFSIGWFFFLGQFLIGLHWS